MKKLKFHPHPKARPSVLKKIGKVMKQLKEEQEKEKKNKDSRDRGLRKAS